MKHAAAFVFGALFGCAVALGLLYLNPLLHTGADPDDAPAWSLGYTLAEANPVVYTDGEWLKLPQRPIGVQPLWESTIHRTALGVYGLQSSPELQPDAVATRISVPDATSDWVRRGPVLTDYWLVTVPGRGSLFADIDNNLWSFIRDVWVPVQVLDQPWQGPAVIAPTVGVPGSAGARWVGASGEFAGLLGQASERYEIARFSRSERQIQGELRLFGIGGAPPTAEPAAD
jgi:hypothetical protein